MKTESVELSEVSKDKELAELQEHSRTIVKRAQCFLIDSDDSLVEGTNIVAWCRMKAKRIEEKRKFIVAPIREGLNRLNGFFKGILDPFEEADLIVTRNMLNFRRKKQAELDRKNREAEKKAEKKAEKMGVDVSTVIVDEVRQDKQVGAGIFKKVPDYKIVDISLIPDEYWMVDEVKIGKAVRAGIKNIAGISIFEKEDFSRS